jgi:hypothetical protein
VQKCIIVKTSAGGGVKEIIGVIKQALTFKTITVHRQELVRLAQPQVIIKQFFQ